VGCVGLYRWKWTHIQLCIKCPGIPWGCLMHGNWW